MSKSLQRISAAALHSAFSTHASNSPPKTKAKRLPPLSLRLTEEQRSELERLAGGRPLGNYIKSRLFDNVAAGKVRIQKPPIRDHKLLAQVLRALAHADIIKTLGDLYAASNDGALPLSHDAELAVHQACHDIAGMRRDLIFALGLKPEARP